MGRFVISPFWYCDFYIFPTENSDFIDPDNALSKQNSNMETYAANLYPNLVQKEHDFIEEILNVSR